MYKQYYRLKEEPFNITPDPAFFFLSPSHKEALASILYGVEKRKGFLSITGEVGSGKTTVLRAYLDQVDMEMIKVIYLFHPNLSFKDLLETILRELGFPATTSEVFEMVNHLGHVLVEEFRQNRNIVLLIDEAQNIPVETLESLRMLSNLETASTKLIQIVLVGQPELDNMLNRHELRQLKQRIAVRVNIRPLTSEESIQYIEFRLQKAALKNTRVFTPAALKTIAGEAEGIPRVLNILCDNCLISGYGYQEKPITRRIAREVIADFRNRRVPSLSRWSYAAAAVLLLSLGLWGMLTYGSNNPLDEHDPDEHERTLLTASIPNDPSPSAMGPSSPPVAADPSAAEESTPAPNMPSQATPTPSVADAMALIGQGGPAHGNSVSIEPPVLPQTRPAVKTKLAKGDDRGADPPVAVNDSPHDARQETAAGGRVQERGVSTDATGNAPVNASSPSADPERAAEPPERQAALPPDSPGAVPAVPSSSPTVGSESPAAPEEPEGDALVAAGGEAPASSVSPVTDSETSAEPHPPVEGPGKGSGDTLLATSPEAKPETLAPDPQHTGPEMSEPWSRARALFQQGRIAEAGAVWQSTYLDSSANRIAIEVELNCEPRTLPETFEMLSAPRDFYILPYRYQGKLCYRVRLGPYATWSEAASRARQIQGAMGYAKPALKKLIISSDGS